MEVKIKLLSPEIFWILIIIFVLSNAYEERPPIFKSIPTTVKTRENDTVLLPCLVENLGANRVKWWRDETLVGDNGQIIVTDDNLILHKNNTLEVVDVSEKDSGQYTCQVIRPQPWGPINQIHAIQVLYPPRVRLTPSGDFEVGLNEEVEVHCETKGVPPPLITWFYQGEEIPTLNQRQTLKFVANKGSLSGTYACTASNNVGESATAELYLKVISDAPKVSIDRVTVHSAPGLRTEITCLIEASPTPEVDWFMDNRPLRPESKVKFTKNGMKYSLVIERTRLSDFGLYKCHAVNKIGSSYQVIQLTALANMANLRSARQEKLPDRVTLIWEVDSLSPIILYNLLFREYNRYEPAKNWTKLIIPSDGSDGPIHTQMYTITGLKPSTVYEASVLSKNPYGWSRPSNIHKFSTQGVDLESYFTDEDESRGNTISEYFPEYSIRKEGVTLSKSSELTHSTILLLLSALSYSCGYRRAFEDYSTIIKQKYPEISIIGGNYDPPGFNMLLARTFGIMKMVIIAFVLSGINPFEKLGINTPSWWNWCRSNRLWACMMVFFMSNALEGSFITTGAFEISLNDIPVWSKLETGRIPQPPELFQILENHMILEDRLIVKPDFPK